MSIELLPDLDTDSCLMRLRGLVDLDRVADALDAHFSEHSSRTMVWDIRTADVSDITLGKLRIMADRAYQWDDKRRDPRSVGVIEPGIMHMLARLFAAANAARGRKVRFRTCLSMEEALEWAEVKHPKPGWLDQG